MRNLMLPTDRVRQRGQSGHGRAPAAYRRRPQSLTYEQFNAVAFLNSPIPHPVIGWMNDLEHLQVADLQHWYQQWYSPNNAVLVVAGDVDPQAVLKLARKHFGGLTTSRSKRPSRVMKSRNVVCGA